MTDQRRLWAEKRVTRLGCTACMVLFVGGCAHVNTLRGQIDGLRDRLDQAEHNGALACAPRQMAIARANLEFASTELAQGDVARAEEHLRIARPNTDAAFVASSAERCAGAAPVAEPGDMDGDGYPDATDHCPREPEDFDAVEDEDGCPEDQDSDGDGHADSADLCPADPEDVDGYLDTDGCPEPDNDLDGVLDAADHCANDPEDPDGWVDDDGCPDLDNDTDTLADVDDQCPNEVGPENNHGCPRAYQDVEVTGTHIRIHQTIHFEFNRATIRDVSFGILNTVAQVLKDFPSIRLDIQGHSDDRGNDDYNMRLSDQRAHAVRDYLISQGISPDRLTAQGYGETRPIESNRTGRGRALNRRVEFVRTDEGATQAPAPVPAPAPSP